MINLNSIGLEHVQNVFNYVVSFWYFVLPIVLFFYFFPNLVESISLFAFGVILGITYVSPVILNLVNLVNLEWTTMLTQNGLLFNLIIAALCGVILYSIYKAAIFVGSFAVSFVGTLFFIRTFFGDRIVWYIPVVLAIIAGIVAGSFASKSSSKFIGFFAVLLGSFVLSVLVVAFFTLYAIQVNNFVSLWLILVLFLVLFFVRIRILLEKKK